MNPERAHLLVMGFRLFVVIFLFQLLNERADVINADGVRWAVRAVVIAVTYGIFLVLHRLLDRFDPLEHTVATPAAPVIGPHSPPPA